LIVVVAVAAENVQQLLHQSYPVGHGAGALPLTSATLQSAERPVAVGERGRSGGAKVICRSNQNQYTARLFAGYFAFQSSTILAPGICGWVSDRLRVILLTYTCFRSGFHPCLGVGAGWYRGAHIGDLIVQRNKPKCDTGKDTVTISSGPAWGNS
jgi:hypothetical protein